MPLFFFILILSSCGENSIGKKLFNHKKKSEAFSSVDIKCLENKNDPNHEQDSFLKELDLIYSDNMKKPRATQGFFSAENKESYTIENPLILSPNYFQFKKNELKKQLTEYYSYSIESQIFDLRSNYLRYKFNNCRKSELKAKNNDDPRSFWFLMNYCKAKGATETCLYQDTYSADKNKIIESFFNLCTKFESKPECSLIINNGLRKKSLHQDIYKFTSKFLNEKYSAYFLKLPTFRNSKFKCEKGSDKVTIKIPFKRSDEKYLKDEALKRMLKRVWDSTSIEFEFVDTEKKDLGTDRLLAINWVDSNVSFVDFLKPDIVNINRNMNISELELILPHEFGHFLGFPDCYVEFMDDKNNLIYFELKSSKNIMCNINYQNKVPEFYLEQFVSESCIFDKK